MTSKKGIPAMDVLPEYFPYRDDGCDVSRTCLRCPLPQCKYDNPGWLARVRRDTRDQQVLAAHRCGNDSINDLARRFGLSIRTVHRILAKGEDSGS